MFTVWRSDRCYMAGTMIMVVTQDGDGVLGSGQRRELKDP